MKKLFVLAGLLAAAAGARAAAISSHSVQGGFVAISTAFRTNIALDNQNGVHITFFDPGPPTRLRYAYRANGVSTFTVTDIETEVGPLSTLTLASLVPHVAYTRETGDLVHARLSGTAWVDDVIETNVGTQTWVSMKIGSDAIPQILYHSSETRRTAYAQRIAGIWSTSTIVTSTYGAQVDLSLDSGDNPRALFYTGTSTDNLRHVTYAYPVSNVFQRRNLFDVGTGTTPVGDLSIAADSQGRVHVAAYDDFNRGLAYLLASATGTPLAGFPMDTAANAGFHNDLKMTSEDRPHILYLSTTVGLRQAVFNGGSLSDAGNWSTSTVHIGTNVGVGVSLAENGLGHFMASYYDEANSRVTWLTDLAVDLSLSGTVLDFAAAAIPGASLRLTGNIASQAVSISSATGAFSVLSLLEGGYTLTPSKPGFSFTPAVRNLVNLQASAINLSFQGGPTSVELQGNRFNPLSDPAVNINVSVLPGRVSVKLYDLQGAKIKTLLDEVVPAGTVNLTWDGRSADGDVVASGIYLVVVESEHVSETKKIAVIK